MSLKKLFGVVGNASIDHAAFLVRTGMFLGAKALFTEGLGWIAEREVGDIEKEGWRAVFLRPSFGFGYAGVFVQLTEDSSHPDEPVTFPGAHLGIQVADPAETARAFKEYYEHAGLECNIEAANNEGTKWFVFIPELLTFALEFVPSGVPANVLLDIQRQPANLHP